MKVIHVVGARPNFMKAAPAISALGVCRHIEQVVVHTGQHYDKNMSDVFFEQLGMPKPDVNLDVGSGSHARTTAEIMLRFEEVVSREAPALVVVYGDVNSTVAAALVAAKLSIPVAHVEAGLRSRDRSMPEELNRLVTDQLSDLLFTPSADGDANLLGEGVACEKIHLVGNLMIDTLVRMLDHARVPESILVAEKYALVTLHRPSNVDEPEMLRRIVTILDEIAQDVQVIFPIHPRTRCRLDELEVNGSNIQFTEPLGYLEFLALQRDAAVVITDSGGIQEETTYLRVPCLTVRENTERPITIEAGTNILVGRDMAKLRLEVNKILIGNVKSGAVPPLWDGRAGERVAKIISDLS